MALGWFVVPFKRRNPGVVPPERYCSMDDFTVQIRADGGDWDETEILGDSALVKVRASAATLALISAAPGVFTVPSRFFRLEDSLADLKAGERNQMENAIVSLGYSQAELDLGMGSSLAAWRSRSLADLFGVAATRRLKPRYDAGADTIFVDGPVQPVKAVAVVDSRVA